MMSLRAPRSARRAAVPVLLACLASALAACTPAGPARNGAASPPAPHRASVRSAASRAAGPRPPLAAPAALVPFAGPESSGAGGWHPAGRLVHGMPAVYETALVPPDGTLRAGIAWMDTKLLSARLYSGSLSPGGLGYKYTAPVLPDAAATLVAAFNGGFKMTDAHGGYYTEGRLIDPLVPGAASAVIYASGAITVGAWGTDVSMTRSVVAVRQNLVPLVASGKPTVLAASPDWQAWGDTCGATSCAASVPGIEHQWRSGLGVTADGALVYVAGPALDPLQLAQLLVRAGVVRGMELDINPGWPVFATYRPKTPGGRAAPSNGTKLLPTRLGAATFFRTSYARDFITMSARPVPGGRTAAPATPAALAGRGAAHSGSRPSSRLASWPPSRSPRNPSTRFPACSTWSSNWLPSFFSANSSVFSTPLCTWSGCLAARSLALFTSSSKSGTGAYPRIARGNSSPTVKPHPGIRQPAGLAGSARPGLPAPHLRSRCAVRPSRARNPRRAARASHA